MRSSRLSGFRSYSEYLMTDLPPLDRSGLISHAIVTIICFVIAPLTIADVTGIPLLHMISFIGAILVFQPFAASVGLVLGIVPWAIFAVMISVGIGAVIGILALCDIFARRSHRLNRMIQKVHERTRQSTGFRKYGMLMFFPFIWVPGLGLYGCTLIAWLFEWRRTYYITVLVSAWIVAVAIVLIASLGIVFAIT
jgi:uncharacterized membrane protein